MSDQITLVDYNTSNIMSVCNMLRKVGAKARICSSPEEILQADKIILPGIGRFDIAMSRLKETHLAEALHEAVITRGVPILGICLGMQMFAEGSEEGDVEGLGWLRGRVQRFNIESAKGLKVPHMGWNYVHSSMESHPMWDNVGTPMRFYFVHSYHFVSDAGEQVAGMANYGYDFVSAVVKDNIWGAQFHPEKSHKYGMQFLKNFVEFA